jgi:hypothetical protein
MINEFNEEINDFIIKVFNYYNGKINIFNKAILNINWANLTECIDAGYSKPPNIVVINPLVIARFNNDIIDLKISILRTMIHELYHTDQIIDYNLYNSDLDYCNYIEYSCELETILYIASHILEINNIFNLDMIYDSDKYAKIISHCHIPGVKYKRRRYNDHILACIDNICNFDKETKILLQQDILNAFTNSKSIILEINNSIIFISFRGELMHIDQFNKLILPYECFDIYNTDYKVIYENGNLLITINFISKNIMCKKI